MTRYGFPLYRTQSEQLDTEVARERSVASNDTPCYRELLAAVVEEARTAGADAPPELVASVTGRAIVL